MLQIDYAGGGISSKPCLLPFLVIIMIIVGSAVFAAGAGLRFVWFC